MKYAYFLAHSPARHRLYCLGRRERDGVGTAIGWYDLASAQGSEQFDGTNKNLEKLNPAGLVVMNNPDRVVVSTKIPRNQSKPESAQEPQPEGPLDQLEQEPLPDAEFDQLEEKFLPEGQFNQSEQIAPPHGQLIIYSMDLQELERRSVRIEDLDCTGGSLKTTLESTGFLFWTDSPGVFVGLATMGKDEKEAVLYRYNVDMQHPVTLFCVIREHVGAKWQHPDTGEAYAVIGGVLCSINLLTLERTKIGALDTDLFIVRGDTVISAKGATLEVYQKIMQDPLPPPTLSPRTP